MNIEALVRAILELVYPFEPGRDVVNEVMERYTELERTAKPEPQAAPSVEPDWHLTATAQKEAIRAQAQRIAELATERDRYREALIRLRDCDWVITPADRMDAVRQIARAALEGK